MHIAKLKIKNYRLLKDFKLDLEQNLSLLIGKNNSGKTSLLSVLDKFLSDRISKNEFSFDDFSIEFKNEIKAKMASPPPLGSPFPFLGISLTLFLEYNEKDDLSNISKVMMDLEPENRTIVLRFEYVLNEESFRKLRADFTDFERKQAERIALKTSETTPVTGPAATAKPASRPKDVLYFLKQYHKDYFDIVPKTIKYNIDDPKNPFEDDSVFIDLRNHPEVRLDRIINFKKISARRDVSNKEPDKSLSSLSSKIYKKMEASQKELKAIEDFKDTLSDTDSQLDGVFSNLFDSVIGKVKQFGGTKIGDSVIEIISTLQHRELLDGNTTVMYKHAASDSLPEHYNGLGYMNLISMIFEIEILLHEFKKEKNEKPSDINLFFIEEPEAHTHPQMQYVFIKNIKSLLDGGIIRDDGENRKLQTIITTHSSHIVSESDFNDIKYFKRDKSNIIAKNLQDLKRDYDLDPKQYEFLKQYLTISRAELFFADKAILIEGDTERILLPTMMKKVDLDEATKLASAKEVDPYLPLLSQNISVIEVGAYSQIFEKFIAFLEIKSLIITDLDSVDNDGEACPVQSGVSYSNGALDFFFGSPTLAQLKANSFDEKIFIKDTTWKQEVSGKLCIVYQTEEEGNNGRSFEESFIHINRPFISGNKDDFKGLKNRDLFDVAATSSYDLAEECIKKKTHFALDILYFSDDKFSNWKIPKYIKEGLLWLKKD